MPRDRRPRGVHAASTRLAAPLPRAMPRRDARSEVDDPQGVPGVRSEGKVASEDKRGNPAARGPDPRRGRRRGPGILRSGRSARVLLPGLLSGRGAQRGGRAVVQHLPPGGCIRRDPRLHRRGLQRRLESHRGHLHRIGGQAAFLRAGTAGRARGRGGCGG